MRPARDQLHCALSRGRTEDLLQPRLELCGVEVAVGRFGAGVDHDAVLSRGGVSAG